MENALTQEYADRLARLIQFETISVEGETDIPKFRRFQQLLFELLPNIRAACSLEDFDGSILMKWQGKDSAAAPVMLMNHQDVVDASGEWSHSPFAAETADGKLWGRGTLDDKGALWAMLQAADELASEGFVPARDVYFEMSCTEETDGRGAYAIARALKERGMRFDMVLDEGGMIVYDPVGGAKSYFAMAGVGEKGCADIKFIARSSGGHASIPGKNTPLVRLGKFMAAVERSRIFKAKMSPVVKEMFKRFASSTGIPLRAVFAHPGFFKPLLKNIVPIFSPAAGALFRTTIAFTMCNGSEGRNVLPHEAWVIGNMRFSHHQGGEKSIKAVSRIAKRYGVEVEVLDPGFASPIGSFKSDAFHLVERAVSDVFPGIKTVPYIMTGASDSRFFSLVCDNCIRFAPFKISDQQLDSIHGTDENVDLDSLVPAVEFYKYIIRNV